ncbi:MULTISPECIES: hypothetical protein [Gammaproteobacteria]|uniref:Uncharacterized protein n=1 Tax=Xanthomonas hortorum pv. gardneri TaxID=2754056 RepID=A0A6V7FPM3_9XANT|nr:hypothetical protein [Xanthomonas hortorum]MDX6960973.1 hypothetical protein [Citrobacter freundii]KLB01304.1 hypothetical protein SM19410_03385 [Xanthomonas hortorum pv. gardneri]KLB03232.1 hypothetical protein SM17710_01260 [Xanthomonas hortorum pv. gardneri]KLB06030.1 hypothetical protein SM18210_02225 [Xanthomonas hortorum pv. gardneri]KLB11538.1 hypothetical protein SM23410_05865 [Xanthomonas hortorum pv. gardneri]
MVSLIAVVAGVLVLGWFLRRLFPALAAAAMVLLAPVWLIGGLLLDLLRWPLAFLRPLGLGLARLFGFVLVLPLLPFIFAWSFFAQLWRQFRPAKSRPSSVNIKPSTPMQAAAKRTADVIDLATWRRQNNGNTD